MAKQVSEDMVAYCTSFKLDLAHMIVALDGEKVKMEVIFKDGANRMIRRNSQETL
jgi:hypothetical protein